MQCGKGKRRNRHASPGMGDGRWEMGEGAVQMEMHSETKQLLYWKGRSTLDSGFCRKESRRDHPAGQCLGRKAQKQDAESGVQGIRI